MSSNRKPPPAKATRRTDRTGGKRAQPRRDATGDSKRGAAKATRGKTAGGAKRAQGKAGGAAKAHDRPGGTAKRVQGKAGGASEGIRLQKVLATAGVASRRAAEELIAQGRVSVNGAFVTTQGTRVDPARDRIEVDGRRIATDPAYDYVIVNKPEGVVTTARDPHGRQTVIDLVESDQRLYPVGRLDVDTTGLVLLTNHGDLAHRLAHPRYGIERVYVATVKGKPKREAIRALTTGVDLEDGPARAKGVRILETAARGARLEVTMTEGRKREVRRMLEAVGHPVERLARVSFGPIRLGRLRSGGMRRLRPDEVGELLRVVGL